MTRETDTWTPSANESAAIAEAIGIDWLEVPFDPARFHAGLLAECDRIRETGAEVDSIGCARLVLARLVEEPDHYGTVPVPDDELPPVAEA